MAGFRKAKAEQAALKIAMYGPPGSGKTFTALLMAEYLGKLEKRRVALVDTERGTDFYVQAVPTRRVHPEAFDIDAMYTRSITEVTQGIRSLNHKEYGVVIIDSITHIWEAAIAAYNGKTTKIGTLPMHAWGSIKKPYKALMAELLSSPLHVIICGRQGNEFEEDEDTGEVKKVGVKMKAEGETAYEPHILLRMSQRKNPDGTADIIMLAEKDRTGILQGRAIVNPTAEAIVKPLLPLLGKVQAKIATEDEVATKDAEAIADDEAKRAAASTELLTTFRARFDLAKTDAELNAVAKELTKEVKATMLKDHQDQLRQHWLARSSAMKGLPVPTAGGDE